MRAWVSFILVFSFIILLSSCGGPKKLSPEKYAELSPQDRIVYLNQQLEKNPNDLQLKRMLYQEYRNIKMNNQAEAVLKQILEADPNQADLQYELGVLAYGNGDYATAYESFLKTLQLPGGENYKTNISNFITGPYLIQQVTTDSTDEGFPVFSPDGKKILYQQYRNGSWDIVEMDLASRNTRVLISTPADEELPYYSPDGSSIVYTSNAEDRRPIDKKFKLREIFKMTLADSFVVNLTQSIADDWLPRFNHAGDKIVFVSERSDLRRVPYSQKQSDIYIMDSDGNFQLPLSKSKANEGGSSFTADDQKILYHSNANGNYDIYIMNKDGSQPQLLIDDPNGDDVNPFASPTGDKMVFFSNRDGNYEIYLANIDGTGQQRLTFHPAEDLNPVFSPDGQTIAFHSNRNGNYDIFFINLNAPASQLTTNDLIARLNQLLANQ